MKVIHEGVDARGGKYKLILDPETGGTTYVWERGHVWAGFEVEGLRAYR